MKRFATSVLVLGLVLGGLAIAPQVAFAATTVSGTITRASGATPVSNADIDFLQNNESVAVTHTDSSGNFSTTNVPAGDYTVRFSMTGLATEYRSVSLPDGASVVLNAALEVESTITGTIRDEHGDPVDFVFISVFREDNGWQSDLASITNTSGTYTIRGLAAGRVKVLAGVDSNLQSTWYTNGYNQATATPIVVPAPGGTLVADIVLPAGAIIGGAVTDSIGTPVESVIVVATGDGLDDTFKSYAGSAGLYSLGGLHPQLYSLAVRDSDYGLFASTPAQSATAVLGSPATANFVVTPELIDVSEFLDEVTLISGPTTVEAGKTYTWVVAPEGNQNVYAILYSSPVYLGAAVRNPDASATLTLTIPADTPAGAHKLTFSGRLPAIEGTRLAREYLDVTVTPAAAPTLPATGVDAAPLGLLALLLGGAGLLALLAAPNARSGRRRASI